MTASSQDIRTVVVEREMNATPQKLWRALTQPHLIEAWLMKNDFSPVVGHHFTLVGGWGGVLNCEVLEIEPERLLSYRWNYDHDDPKLNLRSIVTFTLMPTASGVLLRMEQLGFRPDQRQAFGGAGAGWRTFFDNLERTLAEAPYPPARKGGAPP